MRLQLCSPPAWVLCWCYFLSAFRRSFNEEADLLTFLQKGPSSTSMGSPWKQFLLLSIISGLSGKKSKRAARDSCVRVVFMSRGIKRGVKYAGKQCSVHGSCKCDAAGRIISYRCEGRLVFSHLKDEARSLKWWILHLNLRRSEDAMAHWAFLFCLAFESQISDRVFHTFSAKVCDGCEQHEH